MDRLASILIVEDDLEIRRLIHRALTKASYSVDSVGMGRDVVSTVKKGLHDLVIVDLVLPDADGLELTRQIKAESSAAVIILSGLSDTVDRIIGLEAGADDYLPKPFDPRELLARVRSVLRRAAAPSRSESSISTTFVFDRWQLNIAQRSLCELGGEPVELTSGEFELLQILVENAGRVLTRDQLLDKLHGIDTPAYDRSIDVRVGRLRKRIEENPQRPQIIKTVRNGGYMFSAKVSRD